MLTEAEWEYLSRAGQGAAIWTPFGGGELNDLSSSGYLLSDGSVLRDHSWYYAMFKSPYGSKEVATLMANGFYMFDMGGNVKEWVHDAWTASLGTATVSDPVWENGSNRVVRNGYWEDDPSQIRSSYRNYYSHSTRSLSVGFRVGRTAH